MHPDDRVELENSPTEIKLLCKSAKKDDAGKYNLMMQNEMGFDTVAVNLVVVGQYQPPLKSVFQSHTYFLFMHCLYSVFIIIWAL